MSEQRFDMREVENGTWTVFDLMTGEPADVNGQIQVDLDMESADELVDLLNLLHSQLASGTIH
jgi:hypothetical protein